MSNVRPSQSDLAGELDARILAIRTRQLDLPVERLLGMLDRAELIVDPKHRQLFRWSAGRQSRLVESLLLGLPVPPLAAVELVSVSALALVDGVNRLFSLAHFVNGRPDDPSRKLRLTDCDVVSRLNQSTFEMLPEPLQHRLRTATIRVDVLSKASDPRLHYYLFKRLVSALGTPSEQEVRECAVHLLGDTFLEFVNATSRLPEFVMCIMHVAEERRARRFDAELALRYFAFKNFRHEYRGDRADFLSEFTEAVTEGKIAFDQQSERALFAKTFLVLGATLGENAFTLVNLHGAFGFHFVDDHFEPFTQALQPMLGRIDLVDSGQIDRVRAALVAAKQSHVFRRPLSRPYLVPPEELAARIDVVERELARHLVSE